jgi:hypothetical protein
VQAKQNNKTPKNKSKNLIEKYDDITVSPCDSLFRTYKQAGIIPVLTSNKRIAEYHSLGGVRQSQGRSSQRSARSYTNQAKEFLENSEL